MIHGLSTYLGVNQKLTPRWLDRARAAGTDAIEIFCARQSFDYRERGHVSEIAAYFRDSALRLHSLHAPIYNDDCWGRTGPGAMVNVADLERIRRRDACDELKRVIEVAETMPYRYMVLHMGMSGEDYVERKFDAAFSSLEQLNVFGRDRGVEILLENIPNDLSSASRLGSFLKMTHLDNRYCFDTGHAHMADGVEATFEAMKDRVRSTHVHDNDGANDVHLFPRVAAGGTIDWKKTMELLRSRESQYPLLLELAEIPGMDDPFPAVREVFERLESA